MEIPISWLYGLIGGLLIGFGSILALAVTGKVPGISGIVARLLKPTSGDTAWRALFLIGLIAGAAVVFAVSPDAFQIPKGRTLPVYAIAGLLVGFGTRLGGGCTSGHGVCGMGARAKDAMAATLTFMAAAIATVFIWNLLT